MHGFGAQGRNWEKSSSEIPPDLFLGLLDLVWPFLLIGGVWGGERKGRKGI